MTRTRIEWATHVWNPVVGCTHGCPYCYARRIAHRFHLGAPDFSPTWVEASFTQPFPPRPARIFVNSMSDVADWKPLETCRVIARVVSAPQHTFLFLSKRPWDWWPRMPPNALLGYSVTRQADMEKLLDRGGTVDFYSVEPILERIELAAEARCRPSRWIIVGAETGNRRERVRPETAWLREIADYARVNRVPLFFKDSLAPYWPGELPREFPAP